MHAREIDRLKQTHKKPVRRQLRVRCRPVLEEREYPPCNIQKRYHPLHWPSCENICKGDLPECGTEIVEGLEVD